MALEGMGLGRLERIVEREKKKYAKKNWLQVTGLRVLLYTRCGIIPQETLHLATFNAPPQNPIPACCPFLSLFQRFAAARFLYAYLLACTGAQIETILPANFTRRERLDPLPWPSGRNIFCTSMRLALPIDLTVRDSSSIILGKFFQDSTKRRCISQTRLLNTKYAF